MNLRPVSQPRSAPTEGSNILKNGGGGFDTPYLLRATEVEKDRLFELTDVLNSRFVPSWMGYSIIWHPLLIMGNLSLILILFCLGYLLLIYTSRLSCTFQDNGNTILSYYPSYWPDSMIVETHSPFRISRLEEDKVEGETSLRKSCRQLVDLERLVENLKVVIGGRGGYSHQ